MGKESLRLELILNLRMQGPSSFPYNMQGQEG